jgi:serine/threonine protein kinase
LVPSGFEFARSRSNGQILAEVLAQKGPLALDLCLRYATELATALREMHEEGRSHGSVDPSNVILKSSGAALLPTERRGYTDPLADLIGFGSVLYAMLTGKKPSGDEFRLVPAKPAALKGPASVRAAATRLAERCLTAERETAPDLQKVLTEVRLLNVMSKQSSSEPQSIHITQAPPPPPPLEYAPPQPLAVFAGKAAPIINPPTVTPAPTPVAPAPPPAGDSPMLSDSPMLKDPMKPGEHSPQTRRAKGSHSRPVLKDVMCPKCKGYHVRLSRPRTGFERFLNLLGMGVHRCHRCFYRYIPFFGRKIVQKAK